MVERWSSRDVTIHSTHDFDFTIRFTIIIFLQNEI